MSPPTITKLVSGVSRAFNKAYSQVNGNVLVYLVVVILIFGVLGVTIVSLFTTATTSSATPNDARRAYYTAEAGVRFATGIIKNPRFQENYISEINSTAQYTLSNGSSFTIDVFNPWFISTALLNAPGNNPFTLEIPYDGKIPKDFSIPVSDVSLVNWDTFNGNPPPSASYAQITASSAVAGATSLTITMEGTDDLVVDVDQTLCLAVQPTDADASSLLQEGENIYISAEAKGFFPPRNGAIRIVTADNQAGEYYYEELVDETTRVKLTNLAPMPQTGFTEITNFSTTDWVVLSRSNNRVLVTGTTGDVTSEIGLNKQVWVFPNSGKWTIFEREFIEDAVLKVTDDGIIKTSIGATADDDEIQLGEDVDTDPGFGTMWYGGDKSIGGNSDRCQAGRCKFDKGIRAFFTLDYSGDGEGFVFALINGVANTSDSAGGDVERSELLGYAGDSRENASGAPFLDGSLNGDGLLPPKMGIEFDTRTNFDGNFEQTLIYCNGSSLNPDTRNDPLPGDNPEDAVQYVFWGSEKIGLKGIDPETLKVFDNPTITCRDDDSTYDDNKHDADDIFEKWRFDTDGDVRTKPAVGLDGTVYVGSDGPPGEGRVYAFNPGDRLKDSSEKTLNTENEWLYTTIDNLRSSPALGSTGTVYIGEDGKKVYALSSADGSVEWSYGTPDAVSTSPAIDDIGTEDTIYIGDDAGNFYAFEPDSATPKWKFTVPVTDPQTVPICSKVSRGRPALANYNGRKRVYITCRDISDRTLYALDPADRQEESNTPGSNPFPNDTNENEWIFDTGDQSEYMPGVDPNSGRIYTDTTANLVVGLFPAGAKVWSNGVYNIGDDIDSTPVVDDGGTPADSSDDTIYALANNGILHAVNTQGLRKWTFSSGSNSDRSIPVIGPDGTVYFGSQDQKLYAVGHDGASLLGTEKYSFDTNGAVNSSPAIDPRDETVYVGSDSDYLHAINQLAEPRSFRDESVEDLKMVSSADFTEISFADTNDSNDWFKHGDGMWAVRIEVTRDTVPDIDGNFAYTLNTWVEKCTEAGCSKFLSALFRDTLINYKVSARPPKLDQTIKLSAAEHAKFERFLFGFTSAAASGDTQEAIIKFFELSFIRVTDPDVISDPNLDP